MSAFIENFHFLRPWGLLLVVPAVVLWWFARQSADTTRRWSRVIEPELLRALVVGGTSGPRVGPHDLLLLGWLVAAVAVAGPTWQREPSPFAEGAAPTMIVLKVAPSMTTPDLAPSRLDRARQKIVDLLKLRDGMPAGLVAYAGSAHLVLPPTQDAGVVVGMADALSPGIMPRDGDRLADAVTLAAKVLRDGGQGGSILVIADTVAPGQTEALRQSAGHLPIVFFAMAPAAAVDADASLAAAVSALDAREIETTIDNADVAAIARRLADAPGTPATSEVERWEEAGYWLVPLIALIGLLWFRRGWVLAT
ncbi:MAG: VWA domain-containing protein [Rhodospirillales bacterium]|nr:VWA domain-containing protein [Rhodospirillales bacterium]